MSTHTGHRIRVGERSTHQGWSSSDTWDTDPTAVTGTTSIDQIVVYACNTGTATQKLTIEWGGTTALTI